VGMNLIERSLASLPARQAEQFVHALFAPDQRFARAFHHYWKVVLAQDDITARVNTQRELAEAAGKLIANLGDPNIHTVGTTGIDYQPIGIFGYRDLEAHPFGRKIADVVAAGPLASRCRGASGIAHCVGILDAHASIEILKTMFASIARKAQARDHAQLFFFTSDHRLEGLYRKFGMEFPPELALPDSQHLVGMFDLSVEANRARVDRIEATARTIFVPRAA
jgi:hypothetical protein